MANEKELQLALDKAYMTLLTKKNSCFISTILFSLKFKWDEECPTGYTDGINLGINPDFFMGLTKDVRCSLLAHEAWHVAYLHFDRLMGRDMQKFNIAADYEINNTLSEAGFTIGDGWLLDKKSYLGKCAEEIYDLLPNSPPENPQDGDFGEPKDANGGSMSAADKANIKGQIERTLISASVQSQMSSDDAGAIPASIQRRIDDLVNPKLDWRIIFQNHMNGFSNEDFSFKRPNRRYMPDNYMPSLYSESMSEMAFAVDSSGSVSDEQFRQFIGEITGAKESHSPETLTVIDFTTTVDTVHTIGRDEMVEDLNFNGYGGTDLHCVFKHFKDNPPTVLVVFSDLYCSVVQEDPGYPVIWICIDNPNAQVAFGELIHFDTSVVGK